MGRPLKVLIVEDWEPDAALLAHNLHRAGFDLTYRRVDSLEGIRSAIAEESWDLCLLDYALPGFTARDVLREFKDFVEATPTILSTGTVEEETIEDLMVGGARDAVLKKNPWRLGPTVERILSEAAARWERQHAEQALRESEARFRAFLKHAPVGIHVKDTQLRYLVYSEDKISGSAVSPAEAIGKTAHDIYPKELADGFAAHDRAVLESGKAIEREHTWVMAGEPRTRLILKFPILDETGQVTSVGSISTDITERKRAEEALREREAREKSLMDNLPPYVYVRDRIGRYVVTNKEFERRHGLQPGDAVGKTPHDLYPKETADAFLADDQEILKAGVPVTREMEIAYRGGERLTVLSTKFPVLGADGHPVGIGVVSTDITDRVKIQEQLRQAQKMEAVGQLTGGIAHDFNNLLTVIAGSMDLLEPAVQGDPKMAQRLGAARHAARRGAELTGRLLAFARRQILEPVTTDINEILSGFKSLLSRTLGEHIRIELVGATDLWPVHLDPGQFENSVLNLAVNARDAMPNGGKLTIETANVELGPEYVARFPGLAAGPYAMVAVSDTGAGMPAHVVEHAFEPFFTTKETGKGTGLGLSMVYGFVKQSGGHANIYSEPGKGTTVKLYFPRSDAGKTREVDTEDEAASRGNETILVVEDDPDVRDVAAAMIEDLGYRVVTAENGPAALAALERNSDVHLMLTDFVMPGGMTGADLASRVRDRFPRMKIIYTSGYAEGVVHDPSTSKSDEVWIAKPYERHHLAQKLRAVLDGTSMKGRHRKRPRDDRQ